jgi:RNA polymerase sigma factor (sigma-70 family)
MQLRQRNERRSSWGIVMEQKFPVDPWPLPMDEAKKKELLASAIRRLPRIDFEVLKLRYYTGLTYNEISCLLRVPISTLKSREGAAIKKLRKWLRKNGYLDTIQD